MCESPTARRTVVIPDTDPNGLHMRPAQALVQLALKHAGRVELVRESLRVDAKSIFDVLTLGGEPGVEIVLEAWGDGAEQTVDEIAGYIEGGFAGDAASP